MRRPTFMFLVLAACLCAATTHAEDKAALQARLDRVNKLTALDDPALKPWSMKLSFLLDDDLGKLKEQGTIEESWAGPLEYKITIASPSYTATTIVNHDGRFRTAGVAETPYLLQLLLRQMVHPLPPPQEVAGLAPQTVKMEKPVGDQPDCIMMFAAMRNVPFPQLGLFPTFCMVPGKDLLQASYDYGNLMVARTAMGMFQQKVMPIDIKILVNRVDAASSHLTALKTAPLTDADFAVPASGMERAATEVVHVLWRDLHSEIAADPPHVAPPSIQPAALSAPVEVKILIGTDGVVHSVRLVSTPDARMAAPALWVAANTKFVPHRVDGKLTEVDTVANIYFSNGLGPGEIAPGKRH